jgi:hypothetical protein
MALDEGASGVHTHVPAAPTTTSSSSKERGVHAQRLSKQTVTDSNQTAEVHLQDPSMPCILTEERWTAGIGEQQG